MKKNLNIIYKDWWRDMRLPNGLTRFEIDKMKWFLDKGLKEGRRYNPRGNPEIQPIVDAGLNPLCKIGPFLSTDLLEEFRPISTRIEDVKDDEIYFYVIELLHLPGLYRSLPQIPNEVIDLVNQDRCFVIYDYEHEGQFDYDFFAKWWNECVHQHGMKHIKFENFYFLTGDLSVDEKINNQIEMKFVPSMHFLELCGKEAYEMYENKHGRPTEFGWEFRVRNIKDIDIDKKEKHFLSYNRNCERPHRKAMGAYFQHNNLWNDNIISYLKGSWNDNVIPSVNHKPILPEKYSRALHELDTLKPIEIDTHEIKNKFGFGTSYTDKWEFYQETFLSVVTETLFTDEVFLSEKICKPILSLHPFIIVGAPKMIKKLNDLGFQTFDGTEYIDESYDNIYDPAERLQAIFNVLDNFRKVPKKLLKEWFIGLQPILEHNQKRLLEIGKNKSSKVKFMETFYD
tara:strand:+ start:111 stop:1475 length:1365 start_codon:yes stop_codon:yes gene_type:complete